MKAIVATTTLPKRNRNGHLPLSLESDKTIELPIETEGSLGELKLLFDACVIPTRAREFFDDPRLMKGSGRLFSNDAEIFIAARRSSGGTVAIIERSLTLAPELQ